MIVHSVAQGSRSWLELRAGIPTASEFSKIMTPSGKPSASQRPYLCDLIAERFMGRPLETYTSIDMGRGKDLEPRAVAFYEFTKDMDTKEVGFITDDSKRYGASPDRLVGDDGLIEIKCPTDGVHVSYMIPDDKDKGVDAKYYTQIQGQLWVAEREWVDVLSFHPEMPEALIRVERDEEFIKKLSGAVLNFCDWLEAKWAEVAPRKQADPDESLWLQPEDAEVTR